MNIGLLTNLNDMLQSVLLVIFVSGMLTPRKSRIFTSLAFIAMVSGTFVLTIPLRMNLKPIIMCLVILLATCLLYKDPFKRKMFTGGLLLLFVFISEGIGILLFLVLSNFHYNLIFDFTIQRLIASVFFNLIFVSVSMIANLLISKFQGKIKRYMILFLAGLPICYILFVMVLFYSNRENIREDSLVFAVLGMAISVITDIIVFMIVKTQKTIMNEEKNAALMQIQHDLEYKYYEMALAESQKAVRVKHDVLNQLQTIYSLFLSGDNQQKLIGVEMVESLKSKLENIQETVYCENPIVNIILTLKIQDARLIGIHPSVVVSIPEDIQIEKMDLCSVFSNLLDNAMESCGKMQGPKQFELKAGIKRGYLAIRMTNSCGGIEQDSEGNLMTQKSDKEYHGLGLGIIADIAKKYNGNLDYEITENEFITTVTLQISQ